jgi:hypothetical protein
MCQKRGKNMGYISGITMGKIIRKFLAENNLYTQENYKSAYKACQERCHKISDSTGKGYCYYDSEIIPILIDCLRKNKDWGKNAVINYSVAVLEDVAERARQEDAPIYEGDREVDQWVRLSDVEDAINKHLN